MPTESSATIFELCAEGASATGTLTLVTGDGRSTRTSEDLLNEAESRASGLSDHGLHRGDSVGVVASTNFDFIVGCLAAWRAGLTVVLLPEPSRAMPTSTWKETLGRFMDTAGAKTLLSGRPLPELRHQVILVEDIKSQHGSDLALPQAEDRAFISFTSGTTGKPKGVVISNAIAARRLTVQNLAGVTPGVDHLLSWLPLSFFSAFIASVLMPIVRGIPATIIEQSLIGADLSRWLLEMSRTRATVSMAPTFAFAGAARSIGKDVSEQVDLSNWTTAWVGGESVDAHSLWRFVEATAEFGFDGRALVPAYGSTEASGVSMTPYMEGPTVDLIDNESMRAGRAEPSTNVDDSSMFVAAGTFTERSGLEDVEVRIISEAGNELPERGIGEIYVRSPHVMDGYMDPEVNAQAFDHGWYKTGDLGYLASEYLFPAGRIKDMIIVRGRNIYADDVERAVMGTPEIVAAAAVALPAESTEGLLVVAEFSPGDSADPDRVERDLKKAVWAEIGVSPQEVVLVAAGSLPRTEAGKIRRHLVGRTYKEGGYR